MRAIQVIRVSKTDLQGITAYQTDYSMAALTVRASGSPLQPPDGSAFNLPMATLEGNKQGAFLPSFLPSQLLPCTRWNHGR